MPFAGNMMRQKPIVTTHNWETAANRQFIVADNIFYESPGRAAKIKFQKIVRKNHTVIVAKSCFFDKVDNILVDHFLLLMLDIF